MTDKPAAPAPERKQIVLTDYGMNEAQQAATVDCETCHKTFAGPGFCCERDDCPHAANRRLPAMPAPTPVEIRRTEYTPAGHPIQVVETKMRQAAPATVDSIMALADAYANGRISRASLSSYAWDADSEKRAALRAAVEQLAITPDDYKDMSDALKAAQQVNGLLRERAERAEQDAKRWNAIKPYFRVMSPNIDGQHYWALRGGLPRGANMDEVADAAMKEGK